MNRLDGVRALARRAGLRRSRIAAARMCCERSLLATLGTRSTSAHGRILCYHSVGTPDWGVNDVSPLRFRRQVESALKAGHKFVAAADIARGTSGPGDLALTFDDGLESVATNAVPLLNDYRIPFTLFVVTGWADGEHSWGDVILDWHGIEQLAKAGANIASHSHSHPNFSQIEDEVARYELAESRRLIEQRIGITATEFAIPLGQSSDWTPTAGAAAAECGYEMVYAQSVNRRPQRTVPRTFISRFDGDYLFAAALSGAFDGWEESF
jgi:peptidoglycan/xylan/chitin deacetylase (PgdA/CDA1 family)